MIVVLLNANYSILFLDSIFVNPFYDSQMFESNFVKVVIQSLKEIITKNEFFCEIY